MIVSLRESIPPVLHRCFSARSHADQFLAGSIRMGLLQHYAQTEDLVRGDAMEGKAHFTFEGEIRSFAWRLDSDEIRELPSRRGVLWADSNSVGPNYVCCLTTATGDDLAAIAERFGRYVVRLGNPTTFIDRLRACDGDTADKASRIECGQVIYQDAPHFPAEPQLSDHVNLTSFSKRTQFAVEFEYRILQRCALHLVPMTSLDENGEPAAPASKLIELGSPLEDAKLIEM